MDDWIRVMERARETVLMADRAPETVIPIRPVVYESWRRSKLYGLDPYRVTPSEQHDLDTDTFLVRVAEPVVLARQAALEQTMAGLSLIDHEGRVLRRWVPDRAMRGLMDDHHVVPGFSVAEQFVGTTSAVSLLSGAPLLVDGPEHFSERFRALTCASAPVVHPVTRRTVGSVNLTCRYADSTPFLLAWVTELADRIREQLLAGASRRERLLFDSYLAHNHDTRHPLVSLDEQTIITNAPAARLLGSFDQSLLWEHALTAMGSSRSGPETVALTDGTEVRIECVPVRDASESVGAVLKLKQVADTRAPADAACRRNVRLGRLVGAGPRWRALCRQAADVESGWVLAAGEPGSGRLSVAEAVASRSSPGAMRVLDALLVVDPADWLAELRGGRSGTLVLRHLDALGPALARATLDALNQQPTPVRLLATAELGRSNALLDHFDTVLEVPALRERPEDLPALLTAMTARLTAAGCVPVRWMPDAVQTLARIDWPANLTSLETAVRRVLAATRSRCVDARNLPADLVARASRRRLAGLEQAEAQAIMAALRAAGGNKHQAAASLGIARSTLYRKVRALGIDLSTTAF